jgi:tetratricopeptide (TPR) repeat protein
MTSMRNLIFAVLLFFLMLPLAYSQVEKITFAAGTPEDKDLNLISSQSDPQKQIAMYQDFLQKYAANPLAVTYANWQLSQVYLGTGDLQKATEYGDKAAAGSPHELEILETQVTLAIQAKDNARTFKYAEQGGDAYDSIDTQAKPADMTDEEFKSTVATEKDTDQSSYEFFEGAAFNAIAAEADAKTRMEYIDKFLATFPNTKLQQQVFSYAMLSLSELKDTKRLLEYAQKALAADPNNLPALLLLANTYVDGPEPAKAAPYAQKVVAAVKLDAPATDRSHKISVGVAHSILGRVYAKQEKTGASITELKAATALLKGQDDQQYAVAGYFLGWDYAKLHELTEARALLMDVVTIPGGAQQPARELLAKVNAARAAGK